MIILTKNSVVKPQSHRRDLYGRVCSALSAEQIAPAYMSSWFNLPVITGGPG